MRFTEVLELHLKTSKRFKQSSWVRGVWCRFAPEYGDGLIREYDVMKPADEEIYGSSWTSLVLQRHEARANDWIIEGE